MESTALRWSKARGTWMVSYSHPALLDAGGGPRRIRQPLRTQVLEHAEVLLSHVQALVDNPSYWRLEAQPFAAQHVDARAVDAFYAPLLEQPLTSREVREELLPLPPAERARTVLLLGTTGAGKTTLVRQLLGTHPRAERFPSTSTAKTTVAETELVFADGPFRAVITFASLEEVRAAVLDNAVAATLARMDGDQPSVVLTKLLDHVSQRYRFGYLLGRPPVLHKVGDSVGDDVEDLDAEDDRGLDPAGMSGAGEMATDVAHHLLQIVDQLAAVGAGHRDRLLTPQTDDDAEDALDTALRSDPPVLRLVDDLVELLEVRFDVLTEGQLTRRSDGWPRSWEWECWDRSTFFDVIARFSSNYAPLFGSLLTPLVDGIRVQGPFAPAWAPHPRPPLVLVDTEGLGHTPSSSSALSTSLTSRLEQADVVLLVDNAAQPMQAASIAAMKNVVTSGNASKLVVCFTHFDQVRGDNLHSAAERRQHVLASATNVLASIGEELGRFAERALRSRLDDAVFFASHLQHELDASTRAGTIAQLRALVECLGTGAETLPTGPARPSYDRSDLVRALTVATQRFHRQWRASLGLAVDHEIPKEHWARVKALSRRLAEGWADEYQHLRPAASLCKELQDALYIMLQRPRSWSPAAPDDDEQQTLFNQVAQSLFDDVSELCRRRIQAERGPEWVEAYGQAGPGSASRRAHIIAHDVYETAAPLRVPVVPDDDLILEVQAVMERVAQEKGIDLS